MKLKSVNKVLCYPFLDVTVYEKKGFVAGESTPTTWFDIDYTADKNVGRFVELIDSGAEVLFISVNSATKALSLTILV